MAGSVPFPRRATETIQKVQIEIELALADEV
jgi:hypothetical protein